MARVSYCSPSNLFALVHGARVLLLLRWAYCCCACWQAGCAGCCSMANGRHGVSLRSVPFGTLLCALFWNRVVLCGVEATNSRRCRSWKKTPTTTHVWRAPSETSYPFENTYIYVCTHLAECSNKKVAITQFLLCGVAKDKWISN